MSIELTGWRELGYAAAKFWERGRSAADFERAVASGAIGYDPRLDSLLLPWGMAPVKVALEFSASMESIPPFPRAAFHDVIEAEMSRRTE